MLCLAICIPGAGAWAQDARIHRCIGDNGEPTFSDRKCEPSRELPEPATAQPLPSAASSPQAGAEPITIRTCPRSVGDLRERVAAAFAANSSVGFSGLFLWDGFGYGSAVAPLQELAALIGEPLISIEIDSFARYPQYATFRDERHDNDDVMLELVIRTVAEQERQVPYEATSRFEVIESAGCWWLLMPY